MMRPDKAQTLFFSTLALGAGVLALSSVRGASFSLTMLALLGAAVVLTELIQVPSDENSLDPLDAHPFSFSSSVHIAAALMMGPWAAALVAAFGVLTVDSLRGSGWRQISYNASVFAISAASAGLAFELLGGTPGGLDLPSDYGALGALAVLYYLVNTLFVSAIIAFSSGSSLRPLVLDTFRHGLPSIAGETGLAVAFALRVFFEPWAIFAIVPLVFAVYQAHARLAILRRETARALETFANVVDERDPSTFRHSARVAEYVHRLACGLGLPASKAMRMRWAGRLHDLGKIGVDAAVLLKPGNLDEDEWTAMQRHPRLSARLLRRFRFAAGEARAVEYHHERYDGIGYYNVEPSEIPLAAHFLIVADTYDAMTSDRPYRRALPRDVALAEIEAGAGSQFHPAVAKAFVALERGFDPTAALSDAERADLRRLTLRRGRGAGQLKRGLFKRGLYKRLDLGAATALAGALGALGFGYIWPALGAAAVALAALGWRSVERARARRLAASLRAALVGTPAKREVFERIAGQLAAASSLRWAGLIAWRERDLSGSVELEWSDGVAGPTETALSSWLIREAEAAEGLLVASGAELGNGGHAVSMPLYGRESVSAYLVLVFDPDLPGHVELALRSCFEELAPGLVASPARRAEELARRLAAVS